MATTLTAEDKEYIPARWEDVACPFCGSPESRPFERYGYQHRYQYVRCRACSLAYQNPRPAYDEDFIQTAYEVYSTTIHEIEAKDVENARTQELTESGKIVYREHAHVLGEIESYVPRKGRLLEVGCNTGFFCKVAQDRGWTPVGIEISRTMAEIAHRAYGFETHAGDWLKVKFDRPFEAIYCSHVIEHVPNPREWMARFREVLAPGGIVCLAVPNMQSIDRKFKRGLKRLGLRKDRWAKWRTPDHLYEPCEKSFTRFVRSSGFEILRQYTYPSEWDGSRGAWHDLFHFKLRWGAKSRFYVRPVRG